MADRSKLIDVAIVGEQMVGMSFFLSMWAMREYDAAGPKSLRTLAAVQYGTDGMQEARNTGAQAFLDDGGADWLLWIDTDMGFAPDTAERLLAAADPIERPIVGALCFAQIQDQADGLHGYLTSAVPTVYDWVNLDNGQTGWQSRKTIRPDELTRVAGTGSAMILIHRSAFERIRDEAAPGTGRWYDRVPNPTTGQIISEDLSFCLRAGALDIPIYVHTGVATSHLKTRWLGQDDYWRQIALRNIAESMSEPAEAVAA